MVLVHWTPLWAFILRVGKRRDECFSAERDNSPGPAFNNWEVITIPRPEQAGQESACTVMLSLLRHPCFRSVRVDVRFLHKLIWPRNVDVKLDFLTLKLPSLKKKCNASFFFSDFVIILVKKQYSCDHFKTPLEINIGCLEQSYTIGVDNLSHGLGPWARWASRWLRK